MQIETKFEAPVAEQIWNGKYRLKALRAGDPGDLVVDDTWMRVARALAVNENDPERWTEAFYQAMQGWKWLPGGRITAGAGTGRKVTLFNCYVMGRVSDSISGIFAGHREAAMTMKQGGGVGYDFSTIRPGGADIVDLGSPASGPISFMRCWDTMCDTIMSAGSRRGAMMGVLRCDHPDIVAFVHAKRDRTELRNFNLSVLVTDEFMVAVKAGASWRLHFENREGVTTVEKTIDARELWDTIMRAAYDVAEPGVIFIDRINETNNLGYCETISATNPCGEQPLPPYGACLLSSINLARLVRDCFSENARVNQEELVQLVTVAVRAMDNVIDVSNFPLEEQRKEALDKRRIGLGITGLADALLMCGLRYGSVLAVQKMEEWLEVIAIAAYTASVELAKEKGAFPAFEAEGYLREGTFASTLPLDLQNQIRQHGIRNSHLTSIAPTGTISLYAGNVSSGIEPIFAGSYFRKIKERDGSTREELVEDFAVAKHRKLKNPNRRTDVDGYPTDQIPMYVDAQTLTPEEHLAMQSAAQKYIDSAISKTVNLPEDISFEDYCAVYESAFDSGCKGCTTYRPNDVTGSVISVETGTPKEDTSDPSPRPDLLDAVVRKVQMGDDPAFYVTISDIVENGERRPYEIFVNTKNPEHIAWTNALTITLSAIFRRPHDSSFVVEDLKSVFDPKGGAWWNGTYTPSTVAAIGKVLEDHMKKIGYGRFSEGTPTATEQIKASSVATCVKCHSANVKNEAGCEQCLDCGHSKCG